MEKKSNTAIAKCGNISADFFLLDVLSGFHNAYFVNLSLVFGVYLNKVLCLVIVRLKKINKCNSMVRTFLIFQDCSEISKPQSNFFIHSHKYCSKKFELHDASASTF